MPNWFEDLMESKIEFMDADDDAVFGSKPPEVQETESPIIDEQKTDTKPPEPREIQVREHKRVINPPVKKEVVKKEKEDKEPEEPKPKEKKESKKEEPAKETKKEKVDNE